MARVLRDVPGSLVRFSRAPCLLSARKWEANRSFGTTSRLSQVYGMRTIGAVPVGCWSAYIGSRRQPFHDFLSSNRFLETSAAMFSRKEVVQFHLSDIGEGISEVTIKEWFVKVGDRVVQFDSVCEVQSDKASVTITSRFDGVIKKIHYEVDSTAKVGQALIDIEIESDSGASLEQIDQVTDQDASQSHSSSSDSSDSDTEKEKPVSDNSYKKVLTTPAVRRICMENNLKLEDIKGTGKEGRVLKEDVLKYLETIKPGAADRTPSRPTIAQSAVSKPVETKRDSPPIFSAEKDVTQPITGFKKAMAKTMTQAMNIPHFGLSDDIEMTQLIGMRPMLKKIAEERNIQLSLMPFFIKAASLALKQYPLLNASVNAACDAITYKAAHNIGIAMDTKNGLLVPNIKNVQSLTLLEIASELNRLQELGAKGQLSGSDLSNGTFTLSNIGSIGGQFGIPIILPPEVVIGAIGRINVVPKYNSNGDLVKGQMMTVVWSADHRVIDGATLCRFSNTWKASLENPQIMVLDMK